VQVAEKVWASFPFSIDLGSTYSVTVTVTESYVQGTKVCLYNWHSAGSMDWPFPMLIYKYIFPIKYTEAILSNSTPKLLWFEISKMLIAV